ncbi:MAG TPA: type II toxin-antitoxin system HicB family antitoxin [Oscillospiraceae bacterium]|nr:type II toxin-antitoxin system HicB family antitoxin [Oscillospiraceae bacterium]
MNIRVTVIVQKEGNWYVAKCLENSIASQGSTIEESLDNLRETLELFYEDTTPGHLNVPTFITTIVMPL